MELNPRFQASSFIINKYLEKYCSTNLAELHYLAITNKCMGNNYLDKIDKSFVNCYSNKDYNEYKYAKKVINGYYAKNKDSYFRKVFDYSILKIVILKRERRTNKNSRNVSLTIFSLLF